MATPTKTLLGNLFEKWFGSGSDTHESSSGAVHGGHGGSFSSGSVVKPSVYGQGATGNSAQSIGVGAQFSGSEIGLNGYGDVLRGISDNNNAFNLEQVRMVNDFNAKEAQKNRDWQERMSNTAHQREVQDLIAAGLNPILSSGGVGATTPSGAVASGQKAVADNTFGNGMISLMASAINAQSAERVAQIHAASNAYAANAYAAASRYGSDLNYQSQSAYQKVISENANKNMYTKIFSDILKFIH